MYTPKQILQIPKMRIIHNAESKYFSESEYINFAVLFGSYASGSESELSDLDIGINTSKELVLMELGKIISRLEEIAKKKIHFSLLFGYDSVS